MLFIKLVAYFVSVVRQPKHFVRKPDTASLQGNHTAVEECLCSLENRNLGSESPFLLLTASTGDIISLRWSPAALLAPWVHCQIIHKPKQPKVSWKLLQGSGCRNTASQKKRQLYTSSPECPFCSLDIAEHPDFIFHFFLSACLSAVPMHLRPPASL